MTPRPPSRLARWMRGLAERLAERYYEGPEPPMRLAEQVVAFAAANSGATRGEWMRYAVAMAQSAYRSGYVRGIEWAERDLDRLDVGDPDRLADQQQHDFEWHAPEAPSAQALAERVAGADFLDDLPTDAARAWVLDNLGRHAGGFRVVYMPPEKRGPRA